MKKGIVLLGFIFLFGVVIGWWANGLTSSAKVTFKTAALVVEKTTKKTAFLSEDEVLNERKEKLFLNLHLLSNPQFSELISLLKHNMNLADKDGLDAELIQYAIDLNRGQGNSSDVEVQLLALANVSAIQISILPILIDFYEKTRQNRLAIVQLFKLRNQLSFDSDFKLATKKINDLTHKEIKYLIDTNQKEKLRQFYEYRLVIEPDNYALQMRFALFEYENRHYDNAQRLLSVLIHHSTLSDQALQLLQRIQRQLAQQSVEDLLIALDKKGQQYLVTAMINDHEPVSLILDTGASMTILSPEVVSSLGVYEEDMQDFVRFSTANGEVSAPVINIDKISIQGYFVNDVQVGVLSSFPIGVVDGLLGMNFLGQFTFFIDQENSTLQLTRVNNE